MSMQLNSSKHRIQSRRLCYLTFSLLIVLTMLLSSCQAEEPEAVTADAASNQAAGGATSSAAAESLPENLVQIEPLDPEQAAAPVRLRIPAINLDVPVEPMGWDVVTIDGERTTLWSIPEDAAGWHVNSVGVGGAGTMAISGSQNNGAAVFAPLALGALQPGQDVEVTDADGLVFAYRIREISDPIPVSGATEDEKAEALTFLGDNPAGQLTLITGWPDFTTTHRVFAAADFMGALQ